MRNKVIMTFLMDDGVCLGGAKAEVYTAKWLVKLNWENKEEYKKKNRDEK